MKLEDLTKLGVAEDTAKQIIAQNEAEVAAEAKKLTETVKKFDGVSCLQ